MSRWEPGAEKRLTVAAITLFNERGYDETTVAEIAEAAGLSKRTFFRHFSDKREVLFIGSNELVDRWIHGIVTAPPDVSPMSAVNAGLDEVTDLFADRHSFAAMRAAIITTHPELQERELIKLQALAGQITNALVDRGASEGTATLAAQAGVTVFHVAFARWIAQDDPAAFRQLTGETLQELRSAVS